MNNLMIGYLDLGAGSMLLQMLLAGLLGLSLTIKTYWRKILGWLRKEEKSDGLPQPPISPPADHRR
jgi:hypothetical protein